MRATLTAVGLTLGLAAGAPTRAAGQEIRRVSLEEAMSLFAENSLSLRIARAEAAGLEGAARQTRAYFNPGVAIVREDLGREGEAYHETIVGLEQQLEWPGRTAARGRAAGHGVEAARAGFRADSIRLAFDVRRAYAQSWAAEARETTLARTAVVVARLSSAAERRLEEGDLSAFEARRLRVERARIEAERALAGLEAADARRRLALLVLPEAEAAEVGPAAPLSGVPPVVAEQAPEAVLSARPDLQAAEAALGRAEAELSAAAAGWVPAPTLSVGYKDQSDGFSGAAASLRLPLPLFDRRGGARQEAAARLDAAAVELDLRRREARNDLRGAFDRYESARERLLSLGEGLLEDADALLASAETAYREGELSLVELLDAARAYRDGGTAAVALRAGAWIAYHDVLRAMGRAPEEDR